jgi:histidinol-phosphate aminotransferase
MKQVPKNSLIRPLVSRLQPYTPGEQPKIRNLIKLNTNENPYPPAPSVLKAVRDAVDGRLRLYPNPGADQLREKLARMHKCRPENIVVGNGSDELLALAVRAFVEPTVRSQAVGKIRSRSTVQYFTPSYSLYPVLAEIHGAVRNPVELEADFDLPKLRNLKRARSWDFQAALSLVTTPNAPSGRGYSTAQLRMLCQAQRGVVLLDEAYVDFAAENAMKLALELPNVLVARTFSKAYSLCFQRIGYLAGPEALIAALHKIRDSYNVNGLGQVAATATLAELPYYRKKFEAIIETRESLSERLTELGFVVHPSQTNFILVQPPQFPAKEWLQGLRDKAILVRWFDMPGIQNYLRITIGTPAEADALVSACKAMLKKR